MQSKNGLTQQVGLIVDDARRKQLTAEAYEHIRRAQRLLAEAGGVETRRSVQAKSQQLNDKLKNALIEGTATNE